MALVCIIICLLTSAIINSLGGQLIVSRVAWGSPAHFRKFFCDCACECQSARVHQAILICSLSKLSNTLDGHHRVPSYDGLIFASGRARTDRHTHKHTHTHSGDIAVGDVMTAVNGIRSPTLAQAVEEIKGESGSLLTLE